MGFGKKEKKEEDTRYEELVKYISEKHLEVDTSLPRHGISTMRLTMTLIKQNDRIIELLEELVNKK
ncbi:hypothetical protein [Methanobacterium oryzae]|uniref:hypothetical protein n=1 Tax=Methanobacterium oryzae TaxID=69540 RepID=UPI003D1FCEBB